MSEEAGWEEKKVRTNTEIEDRELLVRQITQIHDREDTKKSQTLLFLLMLLLVNSLVRVVEDMKTRKRKKEPIEVSRHQQLGGTKLLRNWAKRGVG